MFITTYSEFVLKETLKTHDIDLTIDKTHDELSLLRFNFDIKKNPNKTIEVTLNGFNYIHGVGQYLDVMNRILIDRHGWFPSKMLITNLSGIVNKFPYDENKLTSDENKYFDSVTITYDSKYDTEFEIPVKLYHLSIKEYESNILKSGIIPKSKYKLTKHLDRIYVCKHIEDCYNLINQMKFIYSSKKLNNKNIKINTDWIIYEIKTDNINNLKLYKDPNYENGYYVVDNIPPQNISIIETE